MLTENPKYICATCSQCCSRSFSNNVTLSYWLFGTVITRNYSTKTWLLRIFFFLTFIYWHEWDRLGIGFCWTYSQKFDQYFINVLNLLNISQLRCLILNILTMKKYNNEIHCCCSYLNSVVFNWATTLT